MTWDPESDHEQEVTAVVRRELRPTAPVATPPEVERGFLRRCIDWVRGHTADDFGRLKEAGVLTAEGEAQLRQAEAYRKEAEGALLFVQSELAIQEARLKGEEATGKQIENEAARRALSERSPTEDEVSRAERVADAAERVERAMSAIRAEGGGVGFDVRELEALLPPASGEDLT